MKVSYSSIFPCSNKILNPIESKWPVTRFNSTIPDEVQFNLVYF